MALPTRVARAIATVDPLDVVSREFGNAMGRLFNRDVFGDGTGVFAPYAVDVREDTDHIYVEAELPGFSKDEVDLTLENATLTITAERHQEKTEGGDGKGEYLLKERRHTRFSRSFTLPPTVDESKVDAKLTDGILRITLNKREETKPRKINVG